MKTVLKMFAGLLACGACAAACAGTVRTATAPALALDTRVGLVKVVEDAATLRLSTRWDGAGAGTLTVNGAEAAWLGAAEEADHTLDGLAPGEYVCSWTAGASTNRATFCVRGGASVLPPGNAGVKAATAAAIALDTRIGLVKVVEGAATLRLSTRWDGAPEGVLTVNGAEAARLGTAEEADHVLDSLAPGEYVCSWITSASTNLATFCVRGGASALPPDGVGVRTATAAAIPLDTRIGLVKVVEDAATLRLSTRWDGAEAGTLTVNGAEAARLGAAEEADHVLDNLAPGEYVCQWTTGASTNLATFCVRGGASVLPPDGTGVRTATAAAIALDTRIGLVKVVEDAAMLRLSTRWDGVPEGVLTVNGAEAARLGAAEEADHVLDGLAPGEYVCSWTAGASTNRATFCVRGGVSTLPPDGAGVRTATAAPLALDTRIGLVKVVENAATLRLSTRWDGAEAGTLTVNGAEAARLGAAEEADHVLDGLAPGEYVCQWTTGASTNLATFCVRGGASALPPDGAGVRTATAAPLALDTRIGLVKVVEDTATLRLSTRWDGAPEGVLTVNGAEAARLGAAEEADHVLDSLAPGEYVCSWITGASTNLATFCVRGGASVLPPGGAGVRTATAAPLALDTRIGLYKVLPVSDRGVASAVCRLSTRWDGAEAGTLTVNGEEVRTLGAAEEADHRLDNLAPGEYVCRWTVGAAAYLATFSVRGDGAARPPRTGVEVTITGRTATFPYDGREKRAGGFDVAASDPLYTIDDFVFTGCSNVVRTTVGTTPFGMTASDFANVNPDFADVVFHVVDGSVTVTPGAVVNPFDPDDPSAPPAPGALARADCVVVYDGEGHSVSVAPLLNPALAADGAAVTYSPDPSRVPFAPESPVFTNAVSTSVWYRIASPNYEPFTTNALLEIRPRPVTLTSKSATKVYDGTPLAAHAVAVGGDGFVDGEGATYVFTGEQTVVGTSGNTFTYTLNGNTKADNYAITTVDGTLTVTKATIGGGEGDGDEPGDGEVLEGGLSKFDATAMYDGVGHTIDTNALVEAFAAVMGGGETRVDYGYAAAGAAATGQEQVADWREVAPVYTNAGEYVVWYRVTNPNYEDFVHAAKVTIAKRPVALTSGTKLDFVYDGQPHACPYFIKSGQGFVEGEGIIASNWATVTTVAEGEIENTFDHVAQEGTDLANYMITVVTGRIAVAAAPIPVGPGGAITTVGYTNVYDGTAHGVAVSANGLLTVPTYAYAATEDGEWSVTSPVFTDVCDTQVWYRVSAPNYAPVVGSVGVRITPRPVTLTSKSATKVYDGTPLTAHAVAVGGDGFADGEGATYAFTGEQTAVGTSENTFAYTLNGNTKADNYEIATVNGTLTVTKATIGGGEGGGGEPGDGDVPDGGLSKFDTVFVYDGAGHTIDTNALVEAFVAVMDGSETRVDYGYAAAGAAATGQEQNAGLVTDAATGQEPDTGWSTGAVATGLEQITGWQETAPVYTNAGEYVVWYRVTNPNYADFVHAAKVTIAKRPVTLTSRSATKVYDGTPLTVHAVAVGGDGFVDGEGAAYAFTGSQTAVGASENTFTYTLNGNTRADNYEITTVNGTLTVTKAVVEVPTVASKPYNGEVQTADVPESGLYAVYANEGGRESGAYSLVLRLADPKNYAWLARDGVTVAGAFAFMTFTITKQGNAWTVEPSIGSWRTDEQAKQPVAAARYGTVTVAYRGTLANGDAYDSVFSPMNPGSYVACFTVRETEDYAGLYREVPFTVTEKTVEPINVRAAGYLGIYDGKPHSIVLTVTGGNGTPVITYATAKDGVYAVENPAFTDVGIYTVWYRVVFPDFTPIEGSAVVSISRGNGGGDDGFVTVHPAGGNRTVRIRKTWFAGFEGFTDRFGSDLEKAATKGTGKFDAAGNEMQVWQDYVAGTDPTDTASRLAASIEMKDGKPVVHWTPALNGDRVKTGVRVYRVLGRNDLTDGDWSPVVDETDGRYRFFKVTVEMPETEE